MTDPRVTAREAAAQLLRALAGCPGPVRVTVAEGALACIVQVWSVSQPMPTSKGGCRRAGCREDILGLIRDAGKPLTRKEVVRGLKDAKRPHGLGTVAKALAELTASGELVNPGDKRGYRLAAWPRRSRTPSLFG